MVGRAFIGSSEQSIMGALIVNAPPLGLGMVGALVIARLGLQNIPEYGVSHRDCICACDQHHSLVPLHSPRTSTHPMTQSGPV